MGGKSYYCDYCKCFMKNDIQVRKTHNDGLTHKIAKSNYMRRFEDPRKVLLEERAKLPCRRYLNGAYCKFDLYCQFRHYNDKQMQHLERIVNKLEKQNNKLDNSANKIDWIRLLPWLSLKQTKGQRKRDIRKLPPSLKSINFNKINEECFKAEWG